jgi:hypothetical protein
MEDPDLGLPKPGRQRQEAGAAVLAGFVPSIQPGGGGSSSSKEES